MTGDLEPGDLVVVPGCGVGRVDGVEVLPVGEDEVVEAYRVELLGGELRCWVPVDRVGQDLRAPVDSSTLEQTWQVIADAEPSQTKNWRRRKQRYEQLVVDNDFVSLATVIGELRALAEVKRAKKQVLSHDERRLLDRATEMFVGEAVVTSGRARAAIERKLEDVVGAD